MNIAAGFRCTEERRRLWLSADKRSDMKRLMAGPRWSKLADGVGRDDVNTIDNKLI